MAHGPSIFKRFLDDARALWDETIFRSPVKLSRLQRFVHFWVLVVRSFARNRCPIRASALSYTTLLALIPVLAVAMSVTTSLLKKQGKEQIEQFIERIVSNVMPPATLSGTGGDTLRGEPDAAAVRAPLPGPAANSNAAVSTTVPLQAPVPSAAAAGSGGGAMDVHAGEGIGEPRLTSAQKKVAEQLYGFVQNAQSGAIAGVGMLVLVYIAMQLLIQIEGTFNDIWGVTRGRSWLVRIVLYWATITLGPLLLAGALSLAKNGRRLASAQSFLVHMPGIGPMVFPLLTLVVIWLTFALLYQLIPNTKVGFSSALVGGFVGGSLWHLNNMFGFLYVSRVLTNSRIYGSLGMVPVFMAGLYLSWLILLFGAQVAYAFQNRSLYLQEKLAENVNQRGREFIALRLMTCLGQRFQRGLRPATIQEMSGELGIPSRLLQQVLQTLITSRLVVEVSGEEAGYSPSRPLESINAHQVLMAVRATQGQDLVTRDEPVREEVYGEFARIQYAEKQAASAVTLLALVTRAQARLDLAPPAVTKANLKLDAGPTESPL
jgi:membrane protein